jgi:creatinine amidohydrolase
MINWWDLVTDIIPNIRESEIGGMYHACELETSVYLAIRPEMVQLDKAKKEVMAPYFSSRFWAPDMFYPQKISWFYGRRNWPKSGVSGDPTKATKEKGERILSTAINNLGDFILELKEK